MVFQNKSVSWKSLRATRHRGAIEGYKEYYRKGVVSLSTPKCLGVTQRSLRVVWLLLGPHHGDFHIQGSQCRGRAPKEG